MVGLKCNSARSFAFTEGFGFRRDAMGCRTYSDKYKGASGGGTYVYDSLTDTLFAGTFKGTIIVP